MLAYLSPLYARHHLIIIIIIIINVPIPSKRKFEDMAVQLTLCDIVGHCGIDEVTISVSKNGGDGGATVTTCGGMKGHNEGCRAGSECVSCECNGRSKCTKP